MATPYKLPSGSWCVKPFSHEEPVYNADGTPVLLPSGRQKMARKYKTITGPTKKAVELEEAKFKLEKEEERAKQSKKKKRRLYSSPSHRVDRQIHRIPTGPE